MISGAYSIGGGGAGILVQDRNYDNIRKSNNPYSEAASSYKGDDDDALSHYMGQSEYGGLSNLGGIGGGLGGPSSLIPTIDTGKSRRMAGRTSAVGKSINNDEPPTLSKNPSNKNYGLFL